MPVANYYLVLGVPMDATRAEIRKAYRRLASAYHPDTNLGDTSQVQLFHAIVEANRVLSDPNERRRHDDALAAEQTNCRAERGHSSEVAQTAPAPMSRLAAILQIAAILLRATTRPPPARWDFGARRYRTADGRFASRRRSRPPRRRGPRRRR